MTVVAEFEKGAERPFVVDDGSGAEEEAFVER
eukprot:CAMPEP_0176456040 /NCGR_PEP_ID=MMETSP0127-20121128/31030_1 /TAXON_ID=938130 /ORGANISM="Platyophrya macrostoma, Strain WH" /LENGTH=31 /DNA_ID= /DNA_START= /DNA_END= /DNA_ORIENTATION=